MNVIFSFRTLYMYMLPPSIGIVLWAFTAFLNFSCGLVESLTNHKGQESRFVIEERWCPERTFEYLTLPPVKQTTQRSITGTGNFLSRTHAFLGTKKDLSLRDETLNNSLEFHVHISAFSISFIWFLYTHYATQILFIHKKYIVSYL